MRTLLVACVLVVGCKSGKDGPIITSEVTIRDPQVHVVLTCRKNRLIRYGGAETNCFYDQPARLTIPIVSLSPGKQVLAITAEAYKDPEGKTRVAVPVEVTIPERTSGVVVLSCTEGELLDFGGQRCGLEAGAVKLTLAAPPSAALEVDGKTFAADARGQVDIVFEIGGRYLERPLSELVRRSSGGMLPKQTFNIPWKSATAGEGVLTATGDPDAVFRAWLHGALAKSAALGWAPVPGFVAIVDERGVFVAEPERKVKELAIVAVFPVAKDPPVARMCSYVDKEANTKFELPLMGAPTPVAVTELATGKVKDIVVPVGDCPVLATTGMKSVPAVLDYHALVKQLGALTF